MSKTAIQEKRLTLDEFLSSPLASENYEYFDGELIQKISPLRYHSRRIFVATKMREVIYISVLTNYIALPYLLIPHFADAQPDFG